MKEVSEVNQFVKKKKKKEGGPRVNRFFSFVSCSSFFLIPFKISATPITHAYTFTQFGVAFIQSFLLRTTHGRGDI